MNCAELLIHFRVEHRGEIRAESLSLRRDLRDTQLHARAIRVRFFSKRFIYAIMREVSDKRARRFHSFTRGISSFIRPQNRARGHFTAWLFNVNEPCNETRVAHNPTIPSPICRQTKRIPRCRARPTRDLTRPPPHSTLSNPTPEEFSIPILRRKQQLLAPLATIN